MEPANDAKALASAGKEAEKAQAVKLLSGDSTEDAAVCVFSSVLDHFEANAGFFQRSRSVESVHQMRVALRRLRAATGLFRRALSGAALETAGERAKSLAGVLGAARNWDVFLGMLAGAPAAALEGDPSFAALLASLEERREKAYLAAASAIEGKEAEIFVADFREALARRDWRASPDATAEGSAADFARAALTRLRMRVLKKSKGLAELTPEERHQIRILLKKTRYAAEFFESLFDSRDAGKFSRAIADMQDGFGVFNDLRMANILLDELDVGDGKSLRASGFLRGWFAHAAQEGVEHARKSEKRLKKLEPFWA